MRDPNLDVALTQGKLCATCAGWHPEAASFGLLVNISAVARLPQPIRAASLSRCEQFARGLSDGPMVDPTNLTRVCWSATGRLRRQLLKSVGPAKDVSRSHGRQMCHLLHEGSAETWFTVYGGIAAAYRSQAVTALQNGPWRWLAGAANGVGGGADFAVWWRRARAPRSMAGDEATVLASSLAIALVRGLGGGVEPAGADTGSEYPGRPAS